MRGVAALLVVFGHARLHAFGQSEPRDHGALGVVLDVISLWGHSAVIVFFALSGFLVGGKLINASTVDDRFMADYAIDRAARIYTVSIPAMAIAVVLGVAFTAIYGQYFSLTNSHCVVTVGDFPPTLLFVIQSLGGGTCANGAFWSLICEVLYYVAFALALAGARWRGRRMISLGLLVLLLGYIALDSLWGEGEVLGYAPIWMMGALFAVPASDRLKWLWGGAIVAMSIALSPLLTESLEAFRDVILGLMVCISILDIRRVTWAPPVWSARAAGALAAVSYSLYLMHAPIMNATRTVLERSFSVRLGRDGVDVVTVAGFFAFVALGVMAGLICYLAFERHTMTVRRWLKSRIVPKPSGGPESVGSERPS